MSFGADEEILQDFLVEAGETLPVGGIDLGRQRFQGVLGSIVHPGLRGPQTTKAGKLSMPVLDAS